MSQDKLSYEFAETGGGVEVGLNDPMLISFKGSYDGLSRGAILAREAIQNALDARDSDDSPVRVEFELNEIPVSELPDSDEFLEIIKACRDSRRDYYKDQEATDFFQNALSRLESGDPVAILRIGDYNTMGVTGGDDEPKGNYYNLFKTLGSSPKGGGSGGSYGLGKGAYYVNSYVRTVFVSSFYGDRDRVFQGKLVLVTYKRNNKKYQHIGSFGLLGQDPVREKHLIPSIFNREERGTDFHIVGFEMQDWEGQIMGSVLNNFWLAILEGELEVAIGGLNITKDNVKRIMERNFPAGDLGDHNPLPHFLAYTDEHSNVFKEKIPILGDVTLYIRQSEEFYNYRKISYFRNTGMEIRRKTHSAPYGFAGVFVCKSVEGNEILRAMENPQHNEWDPSYAEGRKAGDLTKAKKAIRALNNFRKRSLKSIISSMDSEYLDMPEIERYFPGEDESVHPTVRETPYEFGAESEDSGVEIIRKVVIHKPHKPIKPTVKPKTVNLRTRSFAITDENGEVKHIINTRGRPGAKVNLVVEVGTDDSSLPVDITEAKYMNGGILNSNKNQILDLELDKNGETRIMVSFGTNDRYALKITARSKTP